jgi:hypothetical protein
MVFGDREKKWIENVEVPSRKVSAEYGRELTRTFNESRHPGELERTFWCVIPKRPSRPKEKIIKDNIRIASKEEMENDDMDKDKGKEQETHNTTLCPK